MDEWLLVGWAVAASLLGCVAAGRAIRAARALTLLKDLSTEPPQAWPKLSVLITACNEANTLREAMGTLRAQDYPNLEIILVNDRSTDGSDRIVDALAAADPRITPVHVRGLPAGWLGKVHALKVAREHAHGEWLLFTDADVHLAPGALQQAVGACLGRGLDHLAVIPSVRAPGIWLDMTMSAAAFATILKLPIHRVGHPRNDVVFGAGAFNLVRAAALDQTEGLEWMRMEVPDDYALAVLLQRAGARTAVLGGTGCLSLTWYPSLRAMLRRMDKSFYAVRYSHVRLLLVVAFAAWFLGGPVVGAFATGMGPVRMLAGVSYALLALAGVLVSRRLGWPARTGPLLPLGLALLTFGLLRGGLNCWRRGGLEWRGTFYPVAELRAAQRIKP